MALRESALALCVVSPLTATVVRSTIIETQLNVLRHTFVVLPAILCTRWGSLRLATITTCTGSHNTNARKEYKVFTQHDRCSQQHPQGEQTTAVERGDTQQISLGSHTTLPHYTAIRCTNTWTHGIM